MSSSTNRSPNPRPSAWSTVRPPLLPQVRLRPAVPPQHPLPVKDGDKVTKGQVIMVLEAMKMENAIEAPCDGTVTIKAQKGDSVLEGAPLAIIA